MTDARHRSRIIVILVPGQGSEQYSQCLSPSLNSLFESRAIGHHNAEVALDSPYEFMQE